MTLIKFKEDQISLKYLHEINVFFSSIKIVFLINGWEGSHPHLGDLVGTIIQITVPHKIILYYSNK